MTHFQKPLNTPVQDPVAPRVGPLRRLMAGVLCLALPLPGFAATSLADQPLFSNTAVPGNVALALSVEYPTAVRRAHTANYDPAAEFLGYFDPNKCYSYNVGNSDARKYFIPRGKATGHRCTSLWSGNFLNWALMQTIDPFRWAMTGGYRVIDEPALTVLERAWRSGQDGNLTTDRTLAAALVPSATPFGSSRDLKIRTHNLGNEFRFTRSNDTDPWGGNVTHYSNQDSGNGVFEAYARVKVCDADTNAGGVEANCKQYSQGWKPEGLMHQYANRMRFSAFGYLNHTGNDRDGGVLRARQKFVGPTQPVVGSAAVTNAGAEWDPLTGVYAVNPDATDASATNTAYRSVLNNVAYVTNSGVMNYLNKFGETYPGNYKSNDPVSELYYATLRYFRNLGNVPEWSNISGVNETTARNYLDGFPVITSWDDPIQYSCQRNFVIGIGDIYTHADKNVPGNTNSANEPAMPSAVSTDLTQTPSINAVTNTNYVGTMQGMGNSYGTSTNISGNCCSNNGGLMAGLAYWANTQDIRVDDNLVKKTLGRQSVQTYWVDVLERDFQANNQFYLAAKYGGFKVPTTAPWTLNRTEALPESWWRTTTDTVGNQPRPDNYFTAGRPDQMVSSLTKLFANIASELRAYSTSFALAAPQVETTGAISYSSRYDSSNWTGDVSAASVVFDSNGQPTTTELWSASAKMTEQFSGTGWNTNRRIVTRNTATNVGVPFRYGSLSAAQKSALDPSYRTGDDGSTYLEYLRGSRANEMSAENADNRFYRTRASLLGDIVGSKARPIGPPKLALSDSTNPGYQAFREAYAGRPTIVYTGANDGMLHAIRGASTPAATTDGQELFAYVPTATFQGPTRPTATPSIDGLASLGNPDFVHHHMVNATPQVYDVDFQKTPGATPTVVQPTDWRSILIGGMGKGGKSYYALDVTDPASMTSESVVAGKVLWEFTDPDLGFTFGEPAVIRTKRYGWVVILPSGYNNQSGVGHFFVLNPRTGELLQKISTGFGSTSQDAGLAHVNTFVNDRTEAIADAAYAGDLFGNVWRLDLGSTDTSNYPVTKIGVMTQGTAADSPVQPITSRPRIEVSLINGKRFVLFGTGRLLDDSDVNSTQPQALYGLWDGTNDSPTLASTPNYFPIRRADLAQITDLTTGLTTADASRKGWYFQLPVETTGMAWRVISEPAIDAPISVAGFAPMLPNGEACNPQGSSRAYVLNYATGRSALRTQSDEVIDFVQMTGVVTDFDIYSVSGQRRTIVSTDEGNRQPLKVAAPGASGVRLLNWRELRSVE